MDRPLDIVRTNRQYFKQAPSYSNVKMIEYWSCTHTDFDGYPAGYLAKINFIRIKKISLISFIFFLSIFYIFRLKK